MKGKNYIDFKPKELYIAIQQELGPRNLHSRRQEFRVSGRGRGKRKPSQGQGKEKGQITAQNQQV